MTLAWTASEVPYQCKETILATVLCVRMQKRRQRWGGERDSERMSSLISDSVIFPFLFSIPSSCSGSIFLPAAVVKNWCGVDMSHFSYRKREEESERRRELNLLQ